MGTIQEPGSEASAIFSLTNIFPIPGFGASGEVLDSAEFLSSSSLRWTVASSLKQARAEHGMALVYGVPTAIGGLAGGEFLSAMEQFDKSSAR